MIGTSPLAVFGDAEIHIGIYVFVSVMDFMDYVYICAHNCGFDHMAYTETLS